MSTPNKVGDKTQGVPSTSKSWGTCPLVHPRIYAHDSDYVYTKFQNTHQTFVL